MPDKFTENLSIILLHVLIYFNLLTKNQNKVA